MIADALSAMVVALGSGSVASVMTFLATRSKLGYTREEKEIDRLRADHSACEERCAALEKDVLEIKGQLREVEFSGRDSYLARWIKDGEKRITWLNDKAYLTIFAPLKIQRSEVLGHTFAQLLDPDAAGQVDLIDEAALAHPGAVAQVVLRLAPQLAPMTVLKIATTGSDGALIFEGYAFQMPDQEIQKALGAIRQTEQMSRSEIELRTRGKI